MENKIKELNEIIISLENELSSKKYGLIWDRERNQEEVVKRIENELPILKRVPEKDVVNFLGGENLLIEGDNFHSLSAMLYTHLESIDVIYIDPPYNTGNKEEQFKYNDKFVDREDGYRHSKWLNMMEKRLILARKLLSEDGMIFISIDDNEVGQLKLLGDKIFGENNFESFIWKKKGGAGNTEKIIGCLTEYIFCYFKKKRAGIFNYRDIERSYRHFDDISPYNLEGLEKTNKGTYERPTMLFGVIDPETNVEFFPSKDMRWTLGEENMKIAIENKKIYFDYEKKKIYRIKRPEDYAESQNVYYNLFTDVGSLATAKNELLEILGDREIFATPKPVMLMKAILEIASKKNSIILDFFAGSGTMGQAVLEMNKQDGGNRKFILCTNNEGNIINDVTYPRLKNVIEGYEFKGVKKDKLFEKKITAGDLTTNNDNLIETIDQIINNSKNKYDKFEKIIEGEFLVVNGINNHSGFREGLGGNLRYLKTEFIENSNNKDQMRFDLTNKCQDMISVKDNNFKEIIKTDSYVILTNEKNDSISAIYFDLFTESMNDFVNQLRDDKQKNIYIFSLSDSINNDSLNEITNYNLEPIPHLLLETYRKIVKISRGIEI